MTVRSRAEMRVSMEKNAAKGASDEHCTELMATIMGVTLQGYIIVNYSIL